MQMPLDDTQIVKDGMAAFVQRLIDAGGTVAMIPIVYEAAFGMTVKATVIVAIEESAAAVEDLGRKLLAHLIEQKKLAPKSDPTLN